MLGVVMKRWLMDMTVWARLVVLNTVLGIFYKHSQNWRRKKREWERGEVLDGWVCERDGELVGGGWGS